MGLSRMVKVFCITCHKLTNPLIYTVNYLSGFNGNRILIHVDRDSNIKDFQQLVKSNVFLLEERVSVCWGGFSQVTATILLLKNALLIDFDYLFFISGDDLPCKSNKYIDDFLESINFKNMVHFQDERDTYVNPVERVKYNYPSFFFERDKSFYNRMLVKCFSFIKPFFSSRDYISCVNRGVVYFKGTNWFSLNYDTCCKLFSFIVENDWYVSSFKNSFCSDEVFFHTALKYIGVVDLYYNANEASDALRYIDWVSGPEYPRILGESDIYNIKSSLSLFSRKFPPDVPFEIFNELISK